MVHAKGIDEDIHLPPAWAFGVIHGGYTCQKHTLEKVRRLIDEDYPIDAYWIDSCFWDVTTRGPKGYIDFAGDRTAYPDVKGMWDTLHSLGVKAGIWVWDRILKDGQEELFAEFEARGYFKKEKMFGESWHNAGKRSMGGWVDYDNPRACAHWKERMRPLFAAGLDFLKLDAAAYLPYVRTNFELTQEARATTPKRGFVLSHEVFPTDSGEYKRYPTVWTGDSISHWNQPGYPERIAGIIVQGGLKQNVEMVADPGHPNYRYQFLTNDTGGFSSAFGEPTNELFCRWVQFSAFGAVMEVFGSSHFAHQNAPWQYEPWAAAIFRRYTHLRMELFPYIYSCAHGARWEQRRMLSGDGTHRHQYLFGPSLLIAPAVTGRQWHTDVWLPEGTWYDFWTGATFAGGTTLRVPSPVATIPVFVRAGAVIPLRTYARAIETGTNDPLTLLVYAGASSRFDLYEDDGTSLAYLEGGYALTTVEHVLQGSAVRLSLSPANGTYAGMWQERTIIARFRGAATPARVTADAGELPHFDSAGHVADGTPGWHVAAATGEVVVVFGCETTRGTTVTVEPG